MLKRVDAVKTSLMVLFILGAVIWIISLVLTDTPQGVAVRGYNRFQQVEQYDDCQVLVDTETGVSYVKYKNSLSPLYDVDGSLYRPNGWRDYGS